MRLNEIGFYTMLEERCEVSDETTPIMRAEMILTSRCNFKCPYCRGLKDDQKGDMPFETAIETITLLLEEDLVNIRFSGGEPTLYPELDILVGLCARSGVQHIAVSTNGTAHIDFYKYLIECGVNDFSISLDSCCSSFNKDMTGGVDAFDLVVENIKELSKLTYVSVGVVITEDNYSYVPDIVKFAHDLGVADIRIIPAAQQDRLLKIAEEIPQEIIDVHPILKYRIDNIHNDIHVRGIKDTDSSKCGLMLDDLAIVQNKHYPCIIHMREHGETIGEMKDGFRKDRKKWFDEHDCKTDPICQKNCLDCCTLFNTKYEEYHK